MTSSRTTHGKLWTFGRYGLAAALLGALVPVASLSDSSPAEDRRDRSAASPRAELSEAAPDPFATCNTPVADDLPAESPRRCSTKTWGDPGPNGLPIVDPSLPGPWRRDLKMNKDGLTPRIFGGDGRQVVSPRGPVDYEPVTTGRWLPGYRPNTPEAQAELDRWKREQQMRQIGQMGHETAASDSPISNLWGAGISKTTDVEEEPIEYVVRSERYAGTTFNPLKAPQIEVEGPKANGPPSNYHNSGLTWDEYAELKELVQSVPPTLEGQQATENRAPVPLGVSFDAIISPQITVPPDPIMTAGPNHLIGIVNRRYRVWDKDGNPLTSEITLDTFFQNTANCIGAFDVYVDYDEEYDRFVMGGETILGNGDSYLCLAATATNDPTGPWNIYGIRNDSQVPTLFLDYPHMAIGLEAVYIAANMFSDSGGGFNQVRLYALDKQDMYAGTPVQVSEASLGGAYFTAQPAKIRGFTTGGWPAPGTPHFFVAHNNGGSTRIWRWSSPFTSPPTIFGTVSETFNGAPPNAPELNGSPNNLNDTNTGRYFDAEYRDGQLWATRAVGCDFGGGASESCVDWVQIDVSTISPLLIDQQTGGAYGSSGDFRYYPDVAVDRNNNIAIGYTKSSDSTYTQVWVTGREAGDPSGTLQPEILVRAGLGQYTDGAGCNGTCDRWGDYTGMAMDPDGCTFWYMGQFSDGGAARWATRIANFKFDSCSVDSSIKVDKGTYTCGDDLEVTITDNIAISADIVAAQTTISALDGSDVTIDSETILAGDWTGSDCVGADCKIWSTTIAVLGVSGSDNDGNVNVVDGGKIRVFYDDPHVQHEDQTRDSRVSCQTRLDDGGFLIDGGCEMAQGTELYRDYLDAGEYIAYTVGLFNPPSSPSLTDARVTLNLSGPAAGLVTVFNPTIQLGTLGQGALGGAVFNLYVDPAVDDPAYRLSQLDFELSITSPADGYTIPQLLTQTQIVQADDNIVTESECYNFETDEGFFNTNYVFSYPCGLNEGCTPARTVNTVAPPWTRGEGCQSETRTDAPDQTCDVGGTFANKSNGNAGSCTTFAQSTSQLTDGLSYTPIFSPASSGNAANGQPWNYQWQFAEFFYYSDMQAGADTAFVTGQFFANDYQGTSTPGQNEIDTEFQFFSGYYFIPDQDWDSSTPFDPDNPPANYFALGFDESAGGLASSGLQWRIAVEGFDADFGTDPTATPATTGLAFDNLNLVYDLYHAEGQIGVCDSAPATVSFDLFTYQNCRDGALEVTVLDGNAGASVSVVVTSDQTGDSETLTLGGGPNYTMTLSYDSASGAFPDDGVLFVTPDDIIRATYEDADPVATVTAGAFVECPGGDVVVDGIVDFQDNGDGDRFGDTNESVDFTIQLRNESGRALTNVRAIIDSNSPNIDCISKAAAHFGNIPVGGTATNDLAIDPYTFKVASTAQCADPSFPPTADVVVYILADSFDGSTLTQRLNLRLDLNDIGSATVYTEDFSADPVDFTHELGPGDDDGNPTSPDGNACVGYVDEAFWRSTGGNPGGGYFVWSNSAANFPSGTYSDLLDTVLLSPVINLPAGATGATLVFDHEYKFDSTADLLPDGARVDYRVNGGDWQKLTTLPYDGPLILNSYCNPLCNNFGEIECFSENPADGENIFALYDSATRFWTTVQGEVGGLAAGDQLQFRWRVGSMNLTFFGGFPRVGGYGLDNVQVDADQQECDSNVWPDEGCGVVFDAAGNLVQLCGNGNDVVEPTEIWAVDVDLKNVGSSDAVDTTGELAINAGSLNAATLTGNPGAFGTIAADGGIGTATFEFEVSDMAVCVEDIVFDVINVADASRTHTDAVPAFAVQVGETLTQQSASQSTDPLEASGNSVSSDLSPGFGIPAPADSATLSYNFNYSNQAPVETATQLDGIFGVANATAVEALVPAFTIQAGQAANASVFWEVLTYAGNLDRCVRIFLQTPDSTQFDLKAFDAAPAAPYDVLSIYQGPNGGPGTYSIGVEERSGGGCNDTASLSGTSMFVQQVASNGSWTANAQVSLSDGVTTTVVKPFGVADAGPYNVTSLYSGTGTYSVVLEENGGGGVATLASTELTVVEAQCEMGCSGVLPGPPPLADGVVGGSMVLGLGAGPNEYTVDIDAATCTSDHAVVLYGAIGNYSGYQGAVDLGCDIGTGQNATFTHAGDDVWFNVIWVNGNDAAGSAGFATAGERSWSATGLCNVATEDKSDKVCD
jgi:hypothetical protein